LKFIEFFFLPNKNFYSKKNNLFIKANFYIKIRKRIKNGTILEKGAQFLYKKG